MGGAFTQPVLKLGGGKPGSLGVGMVSFLGGYLDEGVHPGRTFQGFGGDDAGQARKAAASAWRKGSSTVRGRS